MNTNIWIVEAREPDGTLDLRTSQPDAVFGTECYAGITEERMANAVFAYSPLSKLEGSDIAHWPTILHPKWIARRRTW